MNFVPIISDKPTKFSEIAEIFNFEVENSMASNAMTTI
jgi:hypothetical protein